MDIKVKYFTDIEPLQEIEGGDWIDLRTARDTGLQAGQFSLIPLGIAMEMPAGYEAHIVPRSSTYKNYKVIQANHMGVIDNSYCGDNDQWMFPAIATEDTFIPKGTRICQFRIMEKQPHLTFQTVDRLSSKDRGGFGSTGRT